jgi:hypothetical protein
VLSKVKEAAVMGTSVHGRQIARSRQALRLWRRSIRTSKMWQAQGSRSEIHMTRPLEALAEEVLQLAPEARAKLLDRVIESLDADRARDAAW